MNRKIVVFTVLCFFTGIVVYAQKTIINDPNAEARVVGNFSAINISGGIDLYLSQGDENGIAVSASEMKYRDRIKTSVENGVLIIKYQSEGWNYGSGNKKMVAYVSFKSLSRLSASGASDVYVNGAIKGDELSIHLSGASDIKGTVEANKLRIIQSGASDASVSGDASFLDISVSGASKFKGYNFETENCTAKASGASDIQVTVTKELSATASGASSIYYKGNGVIKDIRSNGASKINKKG